MFQKILVPLDGSSASERILPHVEALAKASKAAVILLRACPRKKAAADEAQSYLADLQRKLGAAIAPLQVRVATGKPAKAILDFAVREKCDLIAMTTHARTGLKRVIYGSVATGVLAHSPVPLYLALPHVVATPLRAILVPLDGSRRSQALLPLVAELARASGAEVELLWAAHDSSPNATLGVQHNLADAKAMLEKQGIPTTLTTRAGEPAHTILNVAAVEKPDLIAMATHGRTGLDRVRFGSVAQEVLESSKVPLLLQRTACLPATYEEVLSLSFLARQRQPTGAK